jgi:hypothetical protein
MKEQIKSALFRNFFSKRGFLFTISVILFSSTLIFYAQNFSDRNSSSEYQIVLASGQLNSVQLVDDISFDIVRLFGVSIDTNDESSSASVVKISGNISNQPNNLDSLNYYENFVNSSFFPRVAGDETIYLSNLKDGSAEYFIGKSLEFDNNYSSLNVALYPKASVALQRIDINLRANGDLNWVIFSESTGSVQLNFIYVDDSNTFSITKNISPTSLSSLTLGYLDSNYSINFGSIATDRNSSVLVQTNSLHPLSYSLVAYYSSQLDLDPVLINAYLHTSHSKSDTNSMLYLRK